jgi:hypothetical protein
MGIDEELQLIRDKHSESCSDEIMDAEIRYYADKFPHVDIEYVGKERTFHNYKLCDVYRVNDFDLTFSCDKYSNYDFDFDELPPTEIVEVFADLIRRMEDRGYEGYGMEPDTRTHRYRGLQSLYIQIVEDNFEDLSAEEMFKLYEQACGLPVEGDDRKRNGFHSWLLTSAYSGDGGNLSCLNSPLSRWEHRNKFIELLIKNGGQYPND